jgi:hypothetical protein
MVRGCSRSHTDYAFDGNGRSIWLRAIGRRGSDAVAVGAPAEISRHAFTLLISAMSDGFGDGRITRKRRPATGVTFA